MQNVKASPAGLAQSATRSTVVTKRMDYIDNLRTVLTILVIVLHTAVTYGSEGGWYYQEATNDTATTIALTILSAILQSFFMGLFFFLSGYFTPGSADKKGIGKFTLDRILRLGIPCLVFFYAINPLTNFIVDGMILGDPLVYGAHIGVMWFAQALLLVGLLYAALRLVFPTKPNSENPLPLPTTYNLILLIIMMAVLTFGVRYFYPRGTGRWGMIFGDFPQYITMFIVGIIAYRNNWLASIQRIKVRRVGIALGVLLLLLPVMMLLGEDAVYGYDFFMGGIHWQAAAYATWESCMVVVMSLLLLHFFEKKANTQGKLLASMSSSAYTVFIIHPMILVLGTYLLLGLNVHPLLKFVLLASSASVVAFSIAHFIKLIPGTNKIL